MQHQQSTAQANESAPEEQLQALRQRVAQLQDQLAALEKTVLYFFCKLKKTKQSQGSDLARKRKALSDELQQLRSDAQLMGQNEVQAIKEKARELIEQVYKQYFVFSINKC